MTRQLELLRPGQIAAEMALCPRIWLPLGTIEYHSHHLPVGLDGLQAHGLCLDAARIGGGLVYPPLWWGTGGGHSDYPWTVMLPGAGGDRGDSGFYPVAAAKPRGPAGGVVHRPFRR